MEQVRRKGPAGEARRARRSRMRRGSTTLARLDDAAFRRFFSGSPIKRIGRDRFVRNVLDRDRQFGRRRACRGGRAADRRRGAAGARRRDLGAATARARAAFRSWRRRRRAEETASRRAGGMGRRNREGSSMTRHFDFRAASSPSVPLHRRAAMSTLCAAARCGSARSGRGRARRARHRRARHRGARDQPARGEAGADRAPLGRHAGSRPARHPRTRRADDEVFDDPEAAAEAA